CPSLFRRGRCRHPVKAAPPISRPVSGLRRAADHLASAVVSFIRKYILGRPAQEEVQRRRELTPGGNPAPEGTQPSSDVSATGRLTCSARSSPPPRSSRRSGSAWAAWGS